MNHRSEKFRKCLRKKGIGFGVGKYFGNNFLVEVELEFLVF